MIGLMMVLASFAHAQYQTYPAAGGLGGGAPGVMGCAYIQNNRFETFSVPGCTIKRISPSGDAVTYQIKMQVMGPDGKPNSIERTYSQSLQKTNGKGLAITSFEGEDPKKATTSETRLVNANGSPFNSNLMQVRITQRENGKSSKYVVYDRNLCARFKEAGDLQQGTMVLSQCSAMMGKYEDAANEWSAQLKKDGADLGVMAGMSRQGAIYRPARTSALGDLMGVLMACQQYNPEVVMPMPPEGGGGYEGEPAPGPAPRPSPAPGVREAAAKSAI